MATKSKKKKKTSLLTKAKSLGKSKYAPVYAEIAGQQNSNLSLYTGASGQRSDALNREVGSIHAAGATSKKYIGELGDTEASAYQKAMASSQSTTKDFMDKTAANNSDMLSTLQQDMKDRGIGDYERLSPLTADLGKTNSLIAAMGSSSYNRLNEGSVNAVKQNDRIKAMADMMQTSDTSAARGTAQSDLSDLYNKFLAQRMELDTAQRKTKLEQSDYTMQTHETLKDKAAALKAQKAASKAAAAAAAGNLAYKYTALQTGVQYKYDKMDADQKQKDFENNLKTQGFKASIAKQIADSTRKDKDFALKVEKFNWEKTKPSDFSSFAQFVSTLGK